MNAISLPYSPNRCYMLQKEAEYDVWFKFVQNEFQYFNLEYTIDDRLAVLNGKNKGKLKRKKGVGCVLFN